MSQNIVLNYKLREEQILEACIYECLSNGCDKGVPVISLDLPDEVLSMMCVVGMSQ